MPIQPNLLLFLLGSAFATITLDHISSHKHTQTFKQTQSQDHYYVHLIPHTHDDVGWLKTPDEYFYGLKQDTQYAGVDDIISNVVTELLQNPDRKFSYVEMKFFSMWWTTQTEVTKNQVRGLVKEGRLEFLNAGWSMNDEACPHYEDIVNNMMVGHEFLKKEFDGYTPRIGWHIDPFGHSNAIPRLFADMGFDAWFFARLDYQDKARRLDDLEMEFVWRPFYQSLGDDVQIFTHVLYNHYSAPPNLGFDITNGNNPFEDNPSLETFNADDLASQMNEWVSHQALHYRSNHLFITMGDDFNYMNAKLYFYSLDRLISYFNNKYSNVTLLYSTPSNYIDAIKQLDIAWPTKYDDMFPYADADTNFWTGYFTSRATGKDIIRQGSHSLMASTQLYAQAHLDQKVTADTLETYQKAQFGMLDVMGVNLHHDAVTGTGKQAVADNYKKIVFDQMQTNNKLYSELIAEKASKILDIEKPEFTWCFRNNGTYLECPISNTQRTPANFLVAVHNPAQITVTTHAIKMPPGTYQVQGYSYHDEAFVDVVSSSLCDYDVMEGNGQSLESCTLYMNHSIAGNTIGFLNIEYSPVVDQTLRSDGNFIENDFQTITYLGSSDDGEMFELKKKLYDRTFNFAFDLRYWPSSQDDGQNSGVYVFRPKANVTESLRYVNLTSISSQQTDLVSEMHLQFVSEETGSTAFAYLRMYSDSPVIEWDVTLGSLPNNGHGTEVTVNFLSFDIDNNQTFYTDSNGLEMQQRILNYRPTWNWTGSQNVSGNYYPVQTAIAIKDVAQNLQMTVMNSRSQGGSVLRQGRIELMQNRRMFRDDSRGMGEPLNETDDLGNGIVVPARYWLQICDLEHEPSQQRKIQLKQDDPTQTFFSFSSLSASIAQEDVSNHNFDVSIASFTNAYLAKMKEGESDSFKYHLFPLAKNKVLLRVENIGDLFDQTEIIAKPLKIDLQEFCKCLFIDANKWQTDLELRYIDIQEVSLTNNQAYSDLKANKIAWQTENTIVSRNKLPHIVDKYTIYLEHQRIRTFQVEFVLSQAFLQ